MQVKTFSGISTRDVLAQIKREMGEEAVILSKQEGKNANSAWCEITAGIDKIPAQEPVDAPVDDMADASAAQTPPGWNR